MRDPGTGNTFHAIPLSCLQFFHCQMDLICIKGSDSYLAHAYGITCFKLKFVPVFNAIKLVFYLGSQVFTLMIRGNYRIILHLNPVPCGRKPGNYIESALRIQVIQPDQQSGRPLQFHPVAHAFPRSEFRNQYFSDGCMITPSGTI